MSPSGQKVYLLYHVHETDEADNTKLLGVYASEERARRRMRRASTLPGFRDLSEGFEIVAYEVDADEWPEGYVSDGGLDLPAWMVPTPSEDGVERT